MPNKNNSKPGEPDRQNAQASVSLRTRHKLALSFSLLLLVVTSAFWLLFQNELNRSLDEYSNILGASIAEQTAASVRELVLVNDPLGLNVVLTQLVRDNNIIHASVFDVDGKQLASAGQASFNPANSGLYSADINVQDAIAGSIQLELDSSVINTYQSRMRNLFLLIFAVSLVLVVSTAFALAGGITTPLIALTGLINSKTETDDEPTTPGSENEISQLQFSIDNLLQRYEEMEEQLLETGVWQSSKSGDAYEPKRLAASILVVKVVNIHTAIELLHPPTLSKLLREYIFYLNQAASLYGGKIQNQSGDSLLLSFDSDNCSDKHSINALHCAGLFQCIMRRINTMHKTKGEQILEFRMAIHSGDIFMTPNLFNTEQDSASVLGKTIDIAYFLCNQSAPNEVLISDSAFSQAKVFDGFETAGQNELSMPEDNMSFIAYILSSNFSGNNKLIQKQCEHILGPAQ